MKLNRLIYFFPLIVFTSCEPDIDEINIERGNADFSRVVAVGNSLVAGFQNNALSAEGQEFSLPNIVAGQLQMVGGGNFSQPLLTGMAAQKGAGVDPTLFANGLLLPELSLAPSTDCLGESSLAPQILENPYPSTSFFNLVEAGPFNNVAVPGAKVTNLNQPGYGSQLGNPYFARFAATANETMLEQAAEIQASFFMLWIGNNDVLGYATSGGEEGNDVITDPGTFQSAYREALDSLSSNGANGVIANIPEITSIPFFTTIPTMLPISKDQADQLNDINAYGGYNAGINAALDNQIITKEEADLRKIVFAVGENPLVVMDPALTDLTSLNPALINMRQLKEGELLTLRTSGDSLKCGGWGTSKPIPGNFVLSNDEIQKINDAIESYNTFIEQQANNRNLAFVDANELLDQLASVGLARSGINFSSELVSGGAFSFDGVHPSSRGYAILANEFIDAINATYNAKIPKVNINDFPTFKVEGS